MLLCSDFHDYYDVMFDGRIEHSDDRHDDTILIRKSSSGPSRFDMFQLFATKGIPSLAFGTLREDDTPLKEWDQNTPVVLYFSSYGHTGRGKILCESLREASIVGEPWMPVTKYEGLRKGHSVRALSVGGVYDYTYYFSEDWRSNVDPVNIRRIASTDPIMRDFPFNGELDDTYPLYAIDYVFTESGWVACDLNVSPGLKGTPTQEMLDASEVVNLIECGVTKQTNRTIVKRPPLSNHPVAGAADAENRLWTVAKEMPTTVKQYVKSVYNHPATSEATTPPTTPIVPKGALPPPRTPFNPQGKDHNKSLFGLIEEYVEPNFRAEAQRHYLRTPQTESVWGPWKTAPDNFRPHLLLGDGVTDVEVKQDYTGYLEYREKRLVQYGYHESLDIDDDNDDTYLMKRGTYHDKMMRQLKSR